MSHHRRLVARATLRQVKAVRRVQRLAAALDRLAARAAAAAIAELPADPRPWDAYVVATRIRAAVLRSGPPLAALLGAGLGALAAWGHRASGRLLTRAARRTREADDQYADLVIDPPTADRLRRLVGPAPARLTTLAPAQAAADLVYRGIAAGHDRRRIAADLTPVLRGVASAARRVARTEGLRVATASQLAASEQIPGLVAGYQVLAVLDDRTRPEHRRRSGTVYWRHPKPGQLGFADMPHPPIEADGRVAWNCRCTLAPVFATDAVPSAVPDPDEMGRLFAAMSDPERETLVGVERYDLARGRLGRAPAWRDFIGDDTEDLLPLEALAALWKALAG
jgi:SPP1 gp7 family putative phage head morphogenesis protein